MWCKGQGIKQCSFSSGTTAPLNNPFPFVPFLSAQTSNSQREVFLKTLAFYCALREHGYHFWVNNEASQRHDETEQLDGDESEDDEQKDPDLQIESDLDGYEVLQDCQALGQNAGVVHCNGSLHFCWGRHRQPYIHCVLLDSKFSELIIHFYVQM